MLTYRIVKLNAKITYTTIGFLYNNSDDREVKNNGHFRYNISWDESADNF